MSFHTRILPSFVLAALSVVSTGQDLTQARPDGDLVSALAAHQQPYEHLNQGKHDANKELHSYVEEPLNRLLKRIPELKGISPTADQQQLAMILRRTGATVDIFLASLVDLIAHEDIIQQKLGSVIVNGRMPGGLAESKTRLQYNYLILRQGDGSRAEIRELRMNDKGVEMRGVGTNNGFVMTSGFALSCVHFSSAVQWDSKFLHLGEQKNGGKDTHVIAFAQLPGEARNTVTMTAPGVKVNMFVQGIAWVDKASFQIVRMRTDLLAPQSDMGLDEQSTEIRFGEVRFPDVAVPLWLPRDVNVYMKFTDGASLGIFRNVHHYRDYRRYRDSTKILAPN